MLDQIIRDTGRKLNAHPALDRGSLVIERAEAEKAGIALAPAAHAFVISWNPLDALVKALGDIGALPLAGQEGGSGTHLGQTWVALDFSEQLAASDERDNCPGCGFGPGDGLNPDCSHPGGCGYFRSLDVEI